MYMEKIKKHKKKILVGFLILIVLTCASFGGYKYYQHYQNTRFENSNWLSRHINLEENNDGVYEVNTVNTDEDISIFNLVYQDTVESKIKELEEKITIL